MIEKVHQFGEEKNLVGVLTFPPEKSLPKKTTFIFLNCGSLHHIGPYRLHVDLSRELARLGYSAFRMDFSGLGDSERSKGNESYNQRTSRELTEALNLLEKETGNNEFILFGICMGARNGLMVASEETRVKGVIMIDGMSFPTIQYHLKKNLRLFNLRKWKVWLQNQLKGKFGGQKVTGLPKDSRETIFPNKATTEGQLSKVLERNGHLLALFSGRCYHYNYKKQFHQMHSQVPSIEKVQVEFFKNADHTFTLVGQRQLLKNTIFEWIKVKDFK